MNGVSEPRPHLKSAARLLALAAPMLRTGIEQLAVRLDMPVVILGEAGGFRAAIDADDATVVLVDLDAPGATDALIADARAAASDPLVFAISSYWCDRAPRVRRITDGVLHKPPRPDLWQAAVTEALRQRGDALTPSPVPARSPRHTA